MIIGIPDDYHGVISKLACLAKLARHEVRIFRDVAPAPARLIANLRDAEIVVPVRERTRYTREIIGALPRLKAFSQTGRSTHHIDLAA
ncbi:MAG TPA: D-2-hydroxyacid dehydrogenase family protein, partial [Burkholderiales bacterium]|nr:D-2-hydroxyacid dehydrogenase family protein [Burkholderiales bacterium]